MQIYSLVTVDSLKLFEPTMMIEEDVVEQVFQFIEDLSPGTMDELGEDSIL